MLLPLKTKPRRLWTWKNNTRRCEPCTRSLTSSHLTNSVQCASAWGQHRLVLKTNGRAMDCIQCVLCERVCVRVYVCMHLRAEGRERVYFFIPILLLFYVHLKLANMQARKYCHKSARKLCHITSMWSTDADTCYQQTETSTSLTNKQTKQKSNQLSNRRFADINKMLSIIVQMEYRPAK